MTKAIVDASMTVRILERMAGVYRKLAIRDVPRAVACERCRMLYLAGEVHGCAFLP